MNEGQWARGLVSLPGSSTAPRWPAAHPCRTSNDLGLFMEIAMLDHTANRGPSVQAHPLCRAARDDRFHRRLAFQDAGQQVQGLVTAVGGSGLAVQLIPPGSAPAKHLGRKSESTSQQTWGSQGRRPKTEQAEASKARSLRVGPGPGAGQHW
jgi:hypothetical protein